MNTENSPISLLNNWIKSSVTLKMVIITIISLVLLIPSTMIYNIIQERESLNREAVYEVSAKWAGRQQLTGPVLTIPATYQSTENGETKFYTRYLNILPEELHAEGSIQPEKLRRGIYEVVVYKSKLAFSGNFLIRPKIDQNYLHQIRYDEAFLTFGISDLRGIEEQIGFNWGGGTLEVEPGAKAGSLFQSGITMAVPGLEAALEGSIPFSFDLSLQGSQNISFVPLGSITTVDIRSDWTSPSFNGSFLPDQREISDAGFQAHWKVLQLNRNFPQSWMDNGPAEAVNNAAFGVDLLLPLDDYQKSMRSVKYGIMTIALTFLTFFLIEILNKKKIHPFQYILVGLALCLFYILLVSISEHTNFNAAFMVSASAVVSMITLYSATIFKRKKLTVLLLVVLSGVYGFLFVTLQMADYALLLGSLGLTLILATTMYFTRNINWYNVNSDPETDKSPAQK
ncbi:cell envelope integrity protein CreD [Flavilitoribacter nigricans]|uniref:Cell envelope integrity protein CreD n=1 Tax=Flavilitoribacter nigricans (strain ATCC 23147 / DSM 23189 / NBRC 102662 / NCIMB 1420 / SS-2) TaxID=1122177 RepID=A0A2D0NBQ7_FLAN2|nr:cell envelope integrity protein CreD [Flavilitoribacter nigricans]PHN05826.1 cell envelope integrity protein CreD [Flavilitoribacter nigricans DSM 23189 = NBRC 102662]